MRLTGPGVDRYIVAHLKDAAIKSLLRPFNFPRADHFATAGLATFSNWARNVAAFT